MTRAVLALGANVGDPLQQLEMAIAAIANHADISLVERSSIIVTPPWGKTDQNDFHNMVVLVDTGLNPLELLEVCLNIEASLGRVRVERWGPRLIDIDLISYDRQEIGTDRLTVPHPHAHERSFVLDPLREIDPETADWIVNRSRKSSG
jgi:2-amino-4-hydroxy-6-hydroxymethyldihydropteridine diphosphokinase